MNDPGMSELETALRRYCDEIISDLTLPMSDGLVRHVHWRYRGREFRASVIEQPLEGQLSLDFYRAWRANGQRFAQLPSNPRFESQEDAYTWEVAVDLRMWRWALRTAGRRRPDSDDESPGDLTGRPVRPKHGPPTLSASAAAIPELPTYESPRHEVVALAERGGRSGMVW